MPFSSKETIWWVEESFIAAYNKNFILFLSLICNKLLMRPVFSKNIFYLFAAALIVSFSFNACQDEIEPESLLGFEKDFYPLEIGKYWEYKVDSVTYAIGGSIVDSTSSYIREEIVDQFIDATGDTISRFDKSWKRNATDRWEIKKAFTATLSGNIAIRTEDNLRFIKIVLPPNVGTSWDGNAFIDPFQDFRVGGELVKIYKDWDDAEIIDRQASGTVNGNSYESLVTVVLTDTESIIERRYAKEQYAKGVGLVSAEYMILDTQCNGCEDKSWIERAEQGFILNQVLIDHN